MPHGGASDQHQPDRRKAGSQPDVAGQGEARNRCGHRGRSRRDRKLDRTDEKSRDRLGIFRDAVLEPGVEAQRHGTERDRPEDERRQDAGHGSRNSSSDTSAVDSATNAIAAIVPVVVKRARHPKIEPM